LPAPGQFGLTTRMLGMPGLLRAAGGLLEDRPVIKRRQDLGDDRLLQRAGGKALLVATGGVALPGEAGVIAVLAAVAVRGRPDTAVAAAPATQEAGQQVVRGVSGLGAR
jgi:hypothetical protein